MFERFTDRARRVLVLAQENARLLSHNFIGTEHLLLGLIQEGDGVAAHALAELGVTYEAACARIEETIGPAGSATTGSPPFTPRAKKVLELALREALQLAHSYISTEHILLGLVREGEGVAAQTLVGLGVGLPQIRLQVISLLGGERSLAGDAMAEELAAPGPPRQGPRCPQCRSLLEHRVGYRVLPVHGTDEAYASQPVSVMFVYCLHCGVMLAHTSAESAGLVADARSSAVAAPPTRLIDAGGLPGGVHWTLRAGGTDRDYVTELTLDRGADPLLVVPGRGPKLSGSDRMTVYQAWSTEHGLRAIVVRCDPAVVGLSVSHDDGSETAMVQRDPVDGLRFGLHVDGLADDLTAVVGVASDGRIVERFELK